MEKNIELICNMYPVGEKITFEAFEFDKASLNTVFYMENTEYTIVKHGFFNVGDKNYAQIFLDKGLILQICYLEGEPKQCAIFRTYKKYFLRNSMDRGFWFGGKDERGMMFFDDYFWGRDPWEFFGDFLENFISKYFPNIIDMEEFSYEVEDAYCSSNLFSLLKAKNISEDIIKKAFDEEVSKRAWIIDYLFEEGNVEIYYHFDENELEKKFEFMKNTSYYIKMFENNIAYDKQQSTSIFVRDAENEIYNEEYLALVYEQEMSMIYVNIGIPIRENCIRKGE